MADGFTQLFATTFVLGIWLIVDAPSFFWFCRFVWGDVCHFLLEVWS